MNPSLKILFTIIQLCTVCMAALTAPSDTNAPPSEPPKTNASITFAEAGSPTNGGSAHSVSGAASAPALIPAEEYDTNKPIVLRSKAANAHPAEPEAPRFPVHVIPEAISVQTPVGVLVFVERVDVERLARLFPARRVTNIVVYNR